MIIEFEDRTTGADSQFWAYSSMRGLLDRTYDRAVGRGPSVGRDGWFVYGTGRAEPEEVTVRFTLAKGAPPDKGPATQAEAQARYAELAALLRMGAERNIWLCSSSGIRYWARILYGAKNVRLVSAPAGAWYYVEATLLVRPQYITHEQLAADDGTLLTTDSGEPLYGCMYGE